MCVVLQSRWVERWPNLRGGSACACILWRVSEGLASRYVVGSNFGKMFSSKCSIFLSHHFQRISFNLIYFRNSSCHMSVHRLMNFAEQNKCFKYACCESCRKFLCGSNKRNIPGTIRLFLVVQYSILGGLLLRYTTGLVTLVSTSTSTRCSYVITWWISHINFQNFLHDVGQNKKVVITLKDRKLLAIQVISERNMVIL